MGHNTHLCVYVCPSLLLLSMRYVAPCQAGAMPSLRDPLSLRSQSLPQQREGGFNAAVNSTGRCLLRPCDRNPFMTILRRNPRIPLCSFELVLCCYCLGGIVAIAWSLSAPGRETGSSGRERAICSHLSFLVAGGAAFCRGRRIRSGQRHSEMFSRRPRS